MGQSGEPSLLLPRHFLIIFGSLNESERSRKISPRYRQLIVVADMVLFGGMGSSFETCKQKFVKACCFMEINDSLLICKVF